MVTRALAWLAILASCGGGGSAPTTTADARPAPDAAPSPDAPPAPDARLLPDAAIQATCAETRAAHLPRPPASFTAIQIATAASYPTQAAVLDVTGDGREDVVLVSFDPTKHRVGETRVFENDGNATFVEITATALPGGFVPDGARRVLVADLDGDGKDDLYVAQTGFDQGCGQPGACPGAPDALLIQSGGVLANRAPTLLVPYELDGFTHAGAVGDVDGDGLNDIYQGRWPNADASAPVHLEMRRGASFQAEDDRLPADVRNGSAAYSSALFCDVTGDGRPELVLGATTGGATKLLMNDGHGHFTTAPASALPASATESANDYVLDLACLDFDGDGRLDLAILSAGLFANDGNRIVLLHNEGNGTFTDAHLAQSFAASGPSYFQLWARDFNCDGWTDLVVSASPQEYPHLFTNRGDGTFTETVLPSSLAISLLGTWIYPIDAENDGRVFLFAPRGPFEHFLLRPE
jgi:hypothetical protein